MAYINACNDAEELVESAYVDRISAYAALGRRHQAVDAEGLRKLYVAAVENLTIDPLADQMRSAYSEVIAEFHLRSVSPPYQQVAHLLDSLAHILAQRLSALTWSERELIDKHVKAQSKQGCVQRQ